MMADMDHELVPMAVRASHDAAFRRHLEKSGHVECGQENGAHVFRDAVIKNIGRHSTIQWNLIRYSKPRNF